MDGHQIPAEERAAGETAVRRGIDALLAERPPKAGSFIVTLYGDVVVPRGGVLWIGNLIETCGEVGINESLVRTAVSRLVAAGRLRGEREGRRSFYRLTSEARAEFAEAAAILFTGVPEVSDWRIVYLPVAARDGIEVLERGGYARLGPGLAIAPARGPEAPLQDATVFSAQVVAAASLPVFATNHWNLAEHAEAYARFIAAFEPLAAAARAGPPPSGPTALVARLLLVDRFRRVVLRDPALPTAALPADWPGARARRRFAELYLWLSDAADSHVGSAFRATAARLEEKPTDVIERLAALSAVTGDRERNLGALTEH